MNFEEDVMDHEDPTPNPPNEDGKQQPKIRWYPLTRGGKAQQKLKT